jgi:hypothetical protein
MTDPKNSQVQEIMVELCFVIDMVVKCVRGLRIPVNLKFASKK